MHHGGSSDGNNLDRMLAGGASGFVTRALVQPLDVLKIRFQLQIEPIKRSSANSKYKSFTQAATTIVREEGVTSLWKGHVPAQFLSIGYGAVQFSVFHYLVESYDKRFGLSNQSRPVVNFVAGDVAGMTATFVSHPFDVVRTRLVGQGEPKLYLNMTQAFRHIYKCEGVRGLYRGFLPNVLLIGTQAGAIFVTYNFLKRYESQLTKSTSAGAIFSQNFVNGAVAGMVGKTLVYPLDSVKKRLQVQGFEYARSKFGETVTYNGVFDTFVKVIRKEGVLGLFKGFSPSLVKAALTTAAQFAFFENFLLVFSKITWLHPHTKSQTAAASGRQT